MSFFKNEQTQFTSCKFMPFVVQTEYSGESEFNASIRDNNSIIDDYSDELLGENPDSTVGRQSRPESR